MGLITFSIPTNGSTMPDFMIFRWKKIKTDLLGAMCQVCVCEHTECDET